ncbi:DUF968 domain-containing protein [Paracoccus yeei]|uniref:DUF968 domain-containing protein n=1 Tax=Paracoccus yeei TaxID=147645 RepID=UPI001C8E4D69|nr:hypothetical protein [Paracoccus yeei]MBY0137496.1 DUF968 domain-containing protein [Paracoccus yeei]
MNARFGDLGGRGPLGLKQPKELDRPDYLSAVRWMPCIICEEWGLRQLSPTTAHHPIHDRHGHRKRPDITAIPLCDGHHQGCWDDSKIAIHKTPEQWRKAYGRDIDFTPRIQDRLRHLLGY